MSILQGIERARIDTENVHERLINAARDAASDENATLASAERLLRTISGFDEVRRMTRGCDYALGIAFSSSRNIANLARLDSKGRVVCAVLPTARNRIVADNPLFEAAMNSQQIVFSGEIWSYVLRRPVIAAMLPLRDGQGRFAGVVSAAFDVLSLERLLKARNVPTGAVVSLFDKSGIVIASTDIGVAKAIFTKAAANPGVQDRLRSASDAKGDTWSYVTTPLIGNSVFVGYSMPESTLFGPTRLHVGTDFALPIAMIAAAWIAISWAAYSLITKWITYLRRVAAAYRSGHYAVRPALERAPSEFRLLGDALADMAAAIQDRDRRLREAVDQKTTLIREVHHRVKNNLQIVMSLLSLQAGQLRDPAAREALMQAQMRINALALVHRILHEIEDQSTIDLSRLLEELTQQVTGGLGAEQARLKVETDILARDVSGDTAVPLALFTVEALTNIFKHAYPAGQKGGRIAVSLRDIGAGMLRLAVEDNGIGFDLDSRDGKSVGSRLIHTFGLQVGGTSTMRSSSGSGTVVELVFPDPARNGSALENKASAA